MKRTAIVFLALLSLISVQHNVIPGEKGGTMQQEKSFKTTIKMDVKLNYLLFLPEGYEDSKKRWPMILFLHGAGETGNDLSKVKKHGPPKIAENKKDFPFIVVSPQSPQFGWNVQALNALVDEIIAKYRVDEDRVYLTGLSMGGFGTWELAAAHPDRFAAIAPICGGGTRMWSYRLKNMPVWAFHGAKDRAVPLEESERMVNGIKRLRGNAKLTIYPDAGHDSWTQTYGNPKLYEWLLQHRRATKK